MVPGSFAGLHLVSSGNPLSCSAGSCSGSSSYVHVQVWCPVRGREPAASEVMVASPGLPLFRDVTSTVFAFSVRNQEIPTQAKTTIRQATNTAQKYKFPR